MSCKLGLPADVELLDNGDTRLFINVENNEIIILVYDYTTELGTYAVLTKREVLHAVCALIKCLWRA